MNRPLSIYVSDASPQSKTRVLTMFKLHFKKFVPGSNIPNTIEKIMARVFNFSTYTEWTIDL